VTTDPVTPLGVVVLDTNVISELMRPAPDLQVQNWVREVPPATVYTASVTLAEVRFGIARLPAGRRRTLLADAADDVFDKFANRVLPFDGAAADQYGDIVVKREQAGAPISGFDAQIAAICRSRRATLATRNTDDFSRLGLDLIDPWGVDI
jgi:predicted nucleic acid-binding protein